MLLSGPHILFILCRVRWRWLRPGQTLGHGAYAFLDALFFWHGFGESYCQPHFENSLIVVLVRPSCGFMWLAILAPARLSKLVAVWRRQRN